MNRNKLKIKEDKTEILIAGTLIRLVTWNFLLKQKDFSGLLWLDKRGLNYLHQHTFVVRFEGTPTKSLCVHTENKLYY